MDRGSLCLSKLEKALDAAFEPDDLKAVAITVNSPGGSPVQSRLIHDRIRALAEEKEVPVYTFVEDVGASGGYILAIAGDEIFADESSIIGSIGVISGGFGFPELIAKLGVERRVYTAGNNKSQLDPFAPEKEQDLERIQTMLDELHRIFIDLVKRRRSDKLSENDAIFSGEFWPAEMAKNLGLIDQIGECRSVLKARFGKDVEIKKISAEEKSFISKMLGKGPENMPLLDADNVMSSLEKRALWARFGQ